MNRLGPRLLAHTVAGNGDQPVLLLHGLGANRHQPLDLIDRESGSRYIAPDLRAHGATDLPEEAADLTFDHLAADVEDLLAHLVPDQRPVHVMGISMGAGIAVQLLHRGNLDIRRTLLVRPAWHWKPSPPNLDVFDDVATLLTSTHAEEAKQQLRNRTRYRAIARVSEPAATALLAQFDDPRAQERAQRLAAIPRSSPRMPRQSQRNSVHVIGCPLDPIHPMPLAADLAADLVGQFHQAAARYDQPAQHRFDLNAVFHDVISQT